MRAFDKATGEMVWERMIGTEPDGAPMTYAFEGKQYFVFATGGGDHPRELRAYALASRP
jgi:glucose dehydrogenase